MTATETIAEVLNRFPECKWDRFVSDGDELVEVYGWLPRPDGRTDFLVLSFKGIDDAQIDTYLTSSAALDREIAERLGFDPDECTPCQRVEDVFGHLVPGAVQL